jgi:hypothetical protein
MAFAHLFAAYQIPAPEVYAAAASDPDLLMYDQAMRDGDHVDQWKEAAGIEIRTLEQMGTWVKVPTSEAQSKILPGTWAFRRKRSPDGEVKKYKARYCVPETYRKGSSTPTHHLLLGRLSVFFWSLL